MNTSELEPDISGVLCGEQLEEVRSTTEELGKAEVNAVPTVRNFAATTAYARALVSKRRRALRKWRLGVTTTYLKHPLKKPVTVTLPPRARLILIPAKPHLREHDSQNEIAPVKDDVDTTISPEQLGDHPSAGQPLIQLRRSQLARVTENLSKARKMYTTIRKKLRKLNDSLFSEQMLERNGKKVVKISLSHFALELLEEQKTWAEYRRTYGALH